MGLSYLITGANRGIGLELVRQLAPVAGPVLATARRPEAATELQELAKSHPNLRIAALDVADPAQVERFAGEWPQGDPLDVLINNAGVLHEYGAGVSELSLDLIEETFRINVMGPMRMVRALLPMMKASSRPTIVNMSSKVGSIADNTGGGAYGYRISKSALNMFNKSLSIEHKHITSIVMHPGWVQTDMGGSQAPTTPAESAAGMIKVVEGLTLEDTGRFFDFRGDEIPW